MIYRYGGQNSTLSSEKYAPMQSNIRISNIRIIKKWRGKKNITAGETWTRSLWRTNRNPLRYHCATAAGVLAIVARWNPTPLSRFNAEAGNIDFIWVNKLSCWKRFMQLAHGHVCNTWLVGVEFFIYRKKLSLGCRSLSSSQINSDGGISSELLRRVRVQMWHWQCVEKWLLTEREASFPSHLNPREWSRDPPRLRQWLLWGGPTLINRAHFG